MTALDKRNEIDSDCDLEDSDIARRLSCRKTKIKEKIKCNEIEFKNKFVSYWSWGNLVGKFRPRSCRKIINIMSKNKIIKDFPIIIIYMVHLSYKLSYN